MFEAAEVASKLSKGDYKAQAPVLRAELLDAQQQLRGASFSVIVLVAGVDTAGKGETVNLLNQWMDPRWIVTRGYMDPSDEELERPRLWRYWRDLPPRGRIALFLSAWYSSPIRQRVGGRITTAEFDARLDQIAAFERTLADDGTVVLKFWMHLGRAAQEKRLKAFEKDPLRRWRVTKQQWRHWRKYDRFVAAAECAIRRTSTGQAPWRIVEGKDERYRSIVVGTELRNAVRRSLARLSAPAGRSRRRRVTPAQARGASAGALGRIAQEFNVLASLDMGQRLDEKLFKAEVEKQQGRLHLL